jgi:hypothetical protein
VSSVIGIDPAAVPVLPVARGPLSEAVITALRRAPGPVVRPRLTSADPVTDDDLQLALYCCYELHYRGFAGVDPGWEWAPGLLDLRAQLEGVFLEAVAEGRPLAPAQGEVVERLGALLAGAGGPSLSRRMAEHGTLAQMRELCIHRSAYQLKEADPHTFAIPRVPGPAKAAMVHIQADEYGSGDPDAMHATLFAGTMAALDLDPTYGAYLDRLPGITLATVNLVSLFGLHRRWRGAAVGHLAVFEMTSVVPMGRYAAAMRRLGLDAAARFYDVHVEADAEHEVIAAERMVRPLVALEPRLADDVVFGAEALMGVEDRFTRHVLACWSDGRSSLRTSGLRRLAQTA